MKTVAMVVVLGLSLGGSMALGAMDCGRLQKQLVEMQKAQGIILESMVKKNTSLAGTLDAFADDLNSHEKIASESDVLNLRKSAEAFRGHSDRELALIAKFQERSKELINETVQCLSQNGSAATSASNQHLSVSKVSQIH